MQVVQLTHDRPCEMTGISHERLRTKGPYSGHPLPPLLPKGCTIGAFTRWKRPVLLSRGLAEPIRISILTTGRLYGHWHTQTRTGRIENSADASPALRFILVMLQIWVFKMWLEVRSSRHVPVSSKVTRAIASGTVFVPMHWGALWADKAEANALTHPESETLLAT